MKMEAVVVIHDIRNSSVVGRGTITSTAKVPFVPGTYVTVRLHLDTGYRVDIHLSPTELQELVDLLLQELH